MQNYNGCKIPIIHMECDCGCNADSCQTECYIPPCPPPIPDCSLCPPGPQGSQGIQGPPGPMGAQGPVGAI